jgi:hypothetical protein
VPNNQDCDDTKDYIKPTTVWYKDADFDFYTDGTTLIQCTRPTGYQLLSDLQGADVINGVINVLDCDDQDPFATGVPKSWYYDHDKDGSITVANSFLPMSSCVRPPDPSGGKWLSLGELRNSNDCDDNDAHEYPEQQWYLDADGDGYPGSLTPIVQCTRPAGAYFEASELHTPLILDCFDHF